MSSLSAQPTGTAVSLEESYKDVTEWYASRTTVNDASSFRVLAVSLLILPWIVLGFFAFIKFNPNTFLTPRIRKPKGGVVDADFDPNGWLRNYFLKSEIDWLKHGIPYHKKPWSFDNIVVLRFTRVLFHLMCVIAVLAGTTLIPTYNTNTASMSTSFFNETYANATGTNTVTSAADKAQSFLYFDQLNAKITNVDEELLWYPVGVCAAITLIVQLTLIYHTRSLTRLKCQWLATRNDVYLRTLILRNLHSYGKRLSDQSFHERLRSSFQAMGLPAPDVAPSFKLKDSFAEGIIRTALRRICCCQGSDSDEPSGFLTGGGKRKALYHLTVRINKMITRLEKTVARYHMKREELAPVDGRMLSTTRAYPDGPVIRTIVKSLMSEKKGKTSILHVLAKSVRTSQTYRAIKARCISLRSNCHKLRVNQLHAAIGALYSLVDKSGNNSEKAVTKCHLEWLSTLVAKQEHPEARSAFSKFCEQLLKHRALRRQYVMRRKLKSAIKEEPNGYISCILPTIPVAYGALRAIKRQGHFRLLKGKDPDGGYTKIAVKDHIVCAGPVRDMQWDSLGDTKLQALKRQIMFFVTFCSTVLLVTGPVTLLAAGTAKFAYIGRIFPFMEGWVDRHPQVVATISLVLPILIMAFVNGVLVPYLVEELAIFKGEISHSVMNRSVMKHLYFFQVCQTFVLFILFGSVVAFLTNFWQLLRSRQYDQILPSLLKTMKHSPREITNSSTYWLAWLAMQSDFAFFGFLFGWKERFFRWWNDYSTKVPVPRDEFNLQLAEPFDLGYRMSNVIFQMTVALIMVPIAPLCAIIAIIMLFWTYSSYKFQILIICQDDWEGRGGVWETLCSLLQAGLGIMHVILAGVLAYHGQSWILPIGALAPLALLLLANPTIFRREHERLEMCEVVALMSLKFGSKANTEFDEKQPISGDYNEKEGAGSFSQSSIRDTCQTLLHVQQIQEKQGDIKDLLGGKTSSTGKSIKDRLEKRLSKLGRGDLEKARKALVNKKTDYFGHPALNPSMSHPFYNLLLEVKHARSFIMQFTFEIRWKAACGDKKATVAGHWLLTGVLRVTEKGLVPKPTGKITMRSWVVQVSDSLLELWAKKPKHVEIFFKKAFRPGEADKYTVSGT